MFYVVSGHLYNGNAISYIVFAITCEYFCRVQSQTLWSLIILMIYLMIRLDMLLLSQADFF